MFLEYFWGNSGVVPGWFLDGSRVVVGSCAVFTSGTAAHDDGGPRALAVQAEGGAEGRGGRGGGMAGLQEERKTGTKIIH